MCVREYVCVCVCLCTSVSVNICIYICISRCIYIYMSVSVGVSAHVPLGALAHASKSRSCCVIAGLTPPKANAVWFSPKPDDLRLLAQSADAQTMHCIGAASMSITLMVLAALHQDLQIHWFPWKPFDLDVACVGYAQPGSQDPPVSIKTIPPRHGACRSRTTRIPRSAGFHGNHSV